MANVLVDMRKDERGQAREECRLLCEPAGTEVNGWRIVASYAGNGGILSGS